MHTFKRSAMFALAAVLVIAGCAGEDGKDGAAGAPGEDGTDAPIVAGAGFQLSILSATIPATGAPTVTFQATDAAGKPIDVKAETAAGAFGSRGIRFTFAERQADGTLRNHYESSSAGTYAPRAATNFTLAALADMMTMVSPGVYTFTVPATQIARVFTPSQTAVQTIAAFASRSFEGTGYPAADTHDFTPSTGAAAAAREVVSDAACNACHGNMQAHGSRRLVTTCLTCHYPGWTDADSGEGIDFRSMIHKIHTGRYVFNPDTDFTNIVFPPVNSLTNCVACHQGANADNRLTQITRAACGSCHAADVAASADLDATAHLAGFSNDTACAGCHGAGQMRDVAVVHGPTWNSTTDAATYVPKTLDITIDSVNFTDPAAPTVNFTALVDGVGYDVRTNPLATFAIKVAVSTADYESVQGGTDDTLFSTSFAGASSASLVVIDAAAGKFTAPLGSLAVVPNGTSVGVGFEAYIASAGRNYNANYKAPTYAVVGTGTVVPRRTITENAKCNACHRDFGFHSNSSRKGPEYCAFCHTPNNVNDERTNRYYLDPVSGDPYVKTPESVQISIMAHKVHAGGALSNVYTLGTDRSLTTDPLADATTFHNEFVNDLGNCQVCHAPGTYGLPNPANLATRTATFTCTSGDANNVCQTWDMVESFIPPQTAHCTSCHDSDAAKGHAMLNTAGVYPDQIETCAVCHGEGATWDALEVHQPAP